MNGVTQTECTEIQRWLDQGEAFVFLDVRTDWEWNAAHVEGSRLVTQGDVAELQALPKDTRLAFLCHHGVRSQYAAEIFVSQGFTDVHNVVGGIDRWSTTVDAGVPRY